MDQIELTALAVNKKIISPEEGAKILWELIYTQKERFSLTSLSYDSLMDFLVYLHSRFIKMLEVYNPADGTFLAFLHSNIRNSLITWKKFSTRKNVSEESCLGVMEIEYDSEAYKYSCCESSLKPFVNEENHSIEEMKEEWRKRICSKKRKPDLKKEEKLQRDALLILALKSCYNITDELIEKVSFVTQTSRNVLEDMISEAKNSISSKITRRIMCTRARDNAFFYHRKYSLEIPRIRKHSNWAEHLAARYEKHTRMWELANQKLLKSHRMLVPSTKTVASILGMSVRHCEYVMKRVQTDVDKIKLKWYPREHENLPCQRKH
ncbi:hypothetical protein [Treponema sp.]|uniref:hypothetical protein n=1 Tax=Treponema sp. TaxID=166 RepID=UPI0025EF52A2|nr:hypothetical protein [Treponema sp.]MCR5218774.1 hypothetical protein [Treponema sp.]